MGIVSLTMENNNYVILAIEHHEIKGHGEIKSLLRHVRALRNCFLSSIIIFIPESSPGMNRHIWHICYEKNHAYIR